MLTPEEIEQQISEHHAANHTLAQQNPSKQGFKQEMTSNVVEPTEHKEEEKLTKKNGQKKSS